MAVGVAAEVKSKLSIVDVIGESVALKKAGQSFKGLCPFHAEKTASFIVTPARESWHCFGCGLGGDVFSFVMRRDTITFPEALKTLAAKAGVELTEQTSRHDARRARLREVLESAIAFYHQVLIGHRLGGPALDYLHGRGFTDETIERFQLGWAPSGWDVMIRRLGARRDIGPTELVEVGLATARQSGTGFIDRFRSRITFPIRDASGGATGLGGRLLPRGDGRDPENAGPKYLNSPSTLLFDKSRTLYPIDRAKAAIRRSELAVLVEGYTDALMAHQAGFENVVASLGTALTPGQVALLARYARKIALAYDVDPAGQRAGTFGVAELSHLIVEIEQGGTGLSLTEVGVVRLPEARDPDEVIRENPDLWREAVRTPQELVAYLIDYHAGRLDLRTPDGRKRLVDAVMPALRRIRDPVLRDAYLQMLARRSGVADRTLLEALHRPRRTDGSGEPVIGTDLRMGSALPESVTGRLTADAVLAAGDRPNPEQLLAAVTATERQLLRLLLEAPDLQEHVVVELERRGLSLPSTPAREVLDGMIRVRRPGGVTGGSGGFVLAAFLDGLDEESRALAIALYPMRGREGGTERLSGEHAAQGVEQCLLALEKDQLESVMAWTRAELREAEGVGDGEAISRLMDQERLYNAARLSLDRRIEQASLLSRPGGRPTASRTSNANSPAPTPQEVS